jgi:hypothetical protein
MEKSRSGINIGIRNTAAQQILYIMDFWSIMKGTDQTSAKKKPEMIH